MFLTLTISSLAVSFAISQEIKIQDPKALNNRFLGLENLFKKAPDRIGTVSELNLTFVYQ